GGMVASGIIDYEPGSRAYSLPPAHAPVLTRAGGPNNLAFFSQYIAQMGLVESDVVDAFRRGGGVPYSKYTSFQTLQREETAAIYDATLLDVTLPLVQ